MDFSLGEDRQMLVDSLGRFLSDRFPFAARNAVAFEGTGWSRAIWTQMAELGAVGALFEESVGGFGGSSFDVGVVFGEIGRALVTGPWLAALQAGHVLAAAGEVEGLASLIAGESVIGLAQEEAGTAFDPAAIETRATRVGDGWVLDGVKTVVSCAGSLDRLLVVARAGEGLSTFLVDKSAPGLFVRDYLLADGGSAGDVTFAATPGVPVGEIGQAGPVLEQARSLALVALSWEAVAVMDTLRAMTLDYLRTRKQFGIPIGKFQALQHRMATLALEIEQARSAAINAADRYRGDRLERERAASAAKVTIGKVGSLVAEEAIQMHGGIGMTWELALSHYAKRLIMIGHELGDEDFHLARYIELGQEDAFALA
ncbi:acyl-CoA dehydrogenase domain-containing protein [Novosphingobium nitrogenifigens DSM 19370]|uniref:Acyl-CoA dehydrogenase domain-containing protein n=1 Tax=Novosphingobium nitrogenifigens DSM 19370 TaxID=983920 RepID=F1ZD38_9SPHN|nr:acyl-CoA dehydrogenase family protein [Novosphingobium nitrogenifigens]EGD57475.1 acyl-CoA dehydrogenase domain-containing protein [Novosphingobium nitrogenifigens DSM 19370]